MQFKNPYNIATVSRVRNEGRPGGSKAVTDVASLPISLLVRSGHSTILHAYQMN